MIRSPEHDRSSFVSIFSLRSLRQPWLSAKNLQPQIFLCPLNKMRLLFRVMNRRQQHKSCLMISQEPEGVCHD